MVMDPEVGAKDKCLSILDEVILGGVCGQEEEFAWTLLNEIVQQDKQDLRYCCCVLVGRGKMVIVCSYHISEGI